MTLRVAEELSDRTTCIWRQVLHWRGIAGRRRNHDGVIHRAVLFESFHDLRNGRTLLTDCNVAANDVLPFLVDDRVDRNGSLAGLSVADDQLTLAASDRNHRINGFDSRLQRFFDGLAIYDARRQPFDGDALVRIDGSLAVDRLRKSIYNSPNE